MSVAYAEKRIRDALAQTGGNMARAQKVIIEWTRQDSRLLQALTERHMSGIVAYNIQRVAAGKSTQSSDSDGAVAPGASKQEAAAHDKKFGLEVLKAVVKDDATIFGLETYKTPLKRGRASQRHIDAIRKIAGRGNADSS